MPCGGGIGGGCTLDDEAALIAEGSAVPCPRPVAMVPGDVCICLINLAIPGGTTLSLTTSDRGGFACGVAAGTSCGVRAPPSQGSVTCVRGHRRSLLPDKETNKSQLNTATDSTSLQILFFFFCEPSFLS